jgi:hypothetical protein
VQGLLHLNRGFTGYVVYNLDRARLSASNFCARGHPARLVPRGMKRKERYIASLDEMKCTGAQSMRCGNRSQKNEAGD